MRSNSGASLHFRLSFCLAFVLAGLAGCGGGKSAAGNPSPTPPTGSPTPTLAADHVFLVVLENHSFSQVIGGTTMPYLNALAARHALAANYFADTHPSIGNYFMLATGQIESNDDRFGGTIVDDNIVRALTAAGKTWKSYAESLPSAGYTGNDVYPYFKHHNPFTYFSDVLTSSTQAANLVPFSQLSLDLSSGRLPGFGFIVPNAQNDAHDCPGGGTTCADAAKLTAADNWLKTNIDPLITSPAFANSVLIITFDESTDTDPANGGGQVATVVVGSRVRGAFQSHTFYQHPSTLRLILDLLQVTDHPGASAAAPSMAEFFQ